MENLRQVVLIRPSAESFSEYLRDVFQAKDILKVMVWRDLQLRYKQTAVGVAWAIFQPLSMLLIYSLIFGNLAKFPSNGLPYPVFLFAALLPWQYVSRLLSEGGGCVVANGNLVGKIYFPRVILPMTVMFSALADLVIGLAILLVIMAFYGLTPGWQIIGLPLFWVFGAFAALSITLWLSALTVLYRDVNFVVPLLVQLWLYASPIVYSADMVPERFRTLFMLNPIAIMAEGFRWCLFGTGQLPPLEVVAGSAVAVLIVFFSGLRFFRRTEMVFADRI